MKEFLEKLTLFGIFGFSLLAFTFTLLGSFVMVFVGQYAWGVGAFWGTLLTPICVFLLVFFGLLAICFSTKKA